MSAIQGKAHDVGWRLETATKDQLREAAVQVVDFLNGTCRSMHDAFHQLELDEGLEDNNEFCAELDDRLFCCDHCGWWCEMEEEHDHGQERWCDDCHDEEGGDDD